MADEHERELSEDRDSTAEATDVLGAELGPGVDVPPFARGFPNHPQLRTLVEAFEQGRYDVVRDGAPRLAESTDDPAVARAALELRSRLDADPLAVKLLLGTLVLLVLLTSWAYLSHPH